MKYIACTILLALTGQAFGQGDAPTIQQEAQKCAKAILTNDYDTVVKYTHKRVIDGVGGKEAMIAALKDGTEQMRSQGISIVHVKIGDPQKPQKTGEWVTVLIPETITMKVPGGKFVQESCLLGISEDQGKSWVFLDVGPVTKEQLVQIFPELDGKIQLPAKKQPVFNKD